MGLLKYGLAVGLGYALGRPEGRAQLTRLGQQAGGLTQRPEVARLRERGKDLAADQAQKVKQKVTSRSDDTTASATSDATGPATAGRRRLGLRTPSWRPRFSRSRDVHFPAPEDVTPAPTPPLAGTTVMEDSRAAVAGTTAAPRPEAATPSDRS